MFCRDCFYFLPNMTPQLGEYSANPPNRRCRVTKAGQDVTVTKATKGLIVLETHLIYYIYSSRLSNRTQSLMPGKLLCGGGKKKKSGKEKEAYHRVEADEIKCLTWGRLQQNAWHAKQGSKVQSHHVVTLYDWAGRVSRLITSHDSQTPTETCHSWIHQCSL